MEKTKSLWPINKLRDLNSFWSVVRDDAWLILGILATFMLN